MLHKYLLSAHVRESKRWWLPLGLQGVGWGGGGGGGVRPCTLSIGRFQPLFPVWLREGFGVRKWWPRGEIHVLDWGGGLTGGAAGKLDGLGRVGVGCGQDGVGWGHWAPRGPGRGEGLAQVNWFMCCTD